MLAPELTCQLKSIANDTIGANFGKYRFLDDHFPLCSGIQTASDLRIFPFRVLSHYPKVDLSRVAVTNWRDQTGQQTYGPQIHILIKLASNGNQQSPQRNMVGNTREANGAQKNGVMVAKASESVFRHHAA